MGILVHFPKQELSIPGIKVMTSKQKISPNILLSLRINLHYRITSLSQRHYSGILCQQVQCSLLEEKKERFFLNGNIPDFCLSLILEDVEMEGNG